MFARMKTGQSLLFVTLTVTMFLGAQDQLDMTILFDYFPILLSHPFQLHIV